MTTVEIIRNVFRSGFDLRELAWTAWVEPGRIGVEHYTLWAPDGDREDSVGLLLRFPPGREPRPVPGRDRPGSPF
jgi:hypothetical protein